MLKAGIVGAGVFGGHHAEKYAGRADVALTAVYDCEFDRAAALAGRHGAAAIANYDDFLDEVDILTIAAPAAVHFQLGIHALRRDRHIYMEKPLALRVDHADALAEAAAARGLVLQVGHQERLVAEAMGALPANDAPRRVEFLRCGPPSGRCEDVSAVFDLMIHDLDLAARMGFDAPTRVTAVGDEHETVATLWFPGGRSASFVASRRSDVRRRAMTAVFDDGETTLDFIDRTIVSTRTSRIDAAAGAAPADPLGACVSGFVSAVLGERGPLVSGAEASRAVRLAVAVEEARERLAAEAIISANARAAEALLAREARKLTA